MVSSKVSERTCVVCRRRVQLLRPSQKRAKGFEKGFLARNPMKCAVPLFRLVCINGSLVVEEEQRLRGRGAYVHRSLECLAKLLQAGRLSRALKVGEGELRPVEVRQVVEMLMRHVTRSIGDEGSPTIEKDLGGVAQKSPSQGGPSGRRGGEIQKGKGRVRL